MPDAAVTLRSFDDPAAIRGAIYDRVRNAYATSFPIENQHYRLELHDVDYDDEPDIPLAAQKKAIIQGRTLYRRLGGTWRLFDKTTNQPIDERRGLVARVPYMTPRGTFVYNGSEWTLASQSRLKPGVYTRRRENGDLESHFNILPGSGPSFRVSMDPATGVFHANVGQSHFPLYPILKAMGLSDHEMSDAWGRDVFAINAAQNSPRYLSKAYEKFTSRRHALDVGDRKPGDTSDMVVELRDAFQKMRLDPDVTQDTLGERFENVTPAAMLASTRKLRGVFNGEIDVDDRDSLAYQHIMGPEDLLAERVEKDAGQTSRRLLWRATFRKSLDPVLNAGTRTRQLYTALLSSGLGQAVEESNPLDVADQMGRLTRLGEGGLPGEDSIPDEARAVQPSFVGFLDAVRTSESMKAGVDNRVAYRTMKGSDGRLYARMIDRDGREVDVPSTAVPTSIIAFPGERVRSAAEGRKAYAMVRGRMQMVDADRVDFELPDYEDMMSPAAHLVPMVSAMKGHRMLMTTKMYNQALALREPEAPLVQSRRRNADDAEDTFNKWMGRRVGAVYTDVEGTVTKVTPDEVILKTAQGPKRYELYNNLPFNRRSFVTNTPLVQPGQRVRRGELLARSNFTDDKGVLAIGKNLRTAYMPWRGNTLEDAIVISESAAKKLTSEHAYQHDVDLEPGQTISKRAFLAVFPTKYPKSVIDKFDENGVIRPGSVVNKSDPLVLSLTRRQPKGQGVLHKSGKHLPMDTSESWDTESPGVVTDAFISPRGVNVVVKTYRPMEVGDKLAPNEALKGVVSKVVPDDEMPQDAEGRPLELIVHPFNIISRSNPNAALEAALGKIAAKTGKPYRVPGSSETSFVEFVHDELKKHGVSDTEDLYDPVRRAKIPKVFVGNQYWMKLHHLSEDKLSARGDEASYTADMVPAKGGEESSKRFGPQETTSLLSHGSVAVLRDAKLVRGQKNDEFWQAFRLGHTPPTPPTPFVYRKFLDDLKAAGINVKKDGNYVHILAMTDKDVDKMSRGDVTRAETLDFKTMNPVPGGLFDLGLTGGHGGTNWSSFRLSEPMPNPVMEESVRRLLGVTQKRFRDILSGRDSLHERVGGEAIRNALRTVDVDGEIERQLQVVKSGARSKRDDAIKKLRVLTMLKKTGIKPEELVLTKVPVMPPQYRPIVRQGSRIVASHPNALYRELMLADANLRELKDSAGDADLAGERLAVYDSFKALVGVGDPIQPVLQEQRVRGILSHALGLGASPKFSSFQRKVLGTSTDLVGRAVITPDPALNMDQVGIPEDKAWKLYRPFIIRNLMRSGTEATVAARMVANKDPHAKLELMREMERRPVIINRAPTLHRYGIMAAFPVLTKNKTLSVSPVTTSGFGADFDGDSCIGSTIIDLTLRVARYNDEHGYFSKEIAMPSMGREGTVLTVDVVKPDIAIVRKRIQIKDMPRIEASMRVTSSGVVEYDVPAGIKVLSYDAATGRCGFFAVKKFTVHPNCSGFEVRTKKGHVVGVSSDHSLYAFDRKTCSMVRLAPTAALKAAVPIVKRAEARDVLERVDVRSYEAKAGHHRKHHLIDEIEADADFGWWIGAFASDGWVNDHTFSQIHYAKTSPEQINAFCDQCEKMTTSLTYHAREDRHVDEAMRLNAISRKNTINCSALARLCYDWFGHGAKNKKLPDFFTSLPEDCLWGVLSGLIDGDGCVRINNSSKRKTPTTNCQFTTTSEHLLADVRLLCKILGIRTTATSYRDAYVVSFSLADIHANRENIRLRDPEKSAALASMPAPTKDDYDVVPVPYELGGELMVMFHARGDTVEYAAVSSARNGKLVTRRKAFTWLHALRAAGSAHSALSIWEKLLNDTSVTWDVVDEVSPIEPQVMYDLTVEGTNVFAVNDGLVIYDTMQFHVPVSDDAVEEAVTKMLPSKNLLSVRKFDVHYVPTQEFLHGLFRVTGRASSREPRVFRSVKDVEAAYRRGEINADDRVRVQE